MLWESKTHARALRSPGGVCHPAFPLPARQDCFLRLTLIRGGEDHRFAFRAEVAQRLIHAGKIPAVKAGVLMEPDMT